MNNEIGNYLNHIGAQFEYWTQRVIDHNPSYDVDYLKQRVEEFKAKLRIEHGNKFIKVIQGTSVHSFIVLADDAKFKRGDILKAASWKAPAKNFSRGNILNNDYANVQWTGA